MPSGPRRLPDAPPLVRQLADVFAKRLRDRLDRDATWSRGRIDILASVLALDALDIIFRTEPSLVQPVEYLGAIDTFYGDAENLTSPTTVDAQSTVTATEYQWDRAPVLATTDARCAPAPLVADEQAL